MDKRHNLIVIEGGPEWIRSRPDMFFPWGVSAADLAALLVEEALVLGAADVGVVASRGWHIVGADRDWFRLGSFQADDAATFERVLAFPERGQNSLRAEVLVAAFARDIVTVTPSQALAIAGSCTDLDWLRSILVSKNWSRLVAFQLQTAPN